jgi:putative restriction endonuclease
VTDNEEIRAAAGLAMEKIIRDKGSNVLSWSEINEGFIFRGKKIHFATKAAGIFKPKELSDGAALSIKQVMPSRIGREAPYDDHDLEDGVAVYLLQRAGEQSHFNSLLQEAYFQRVPLIFFKGVADGIYEVFYPVFVEEFSFSSAKAKVVFAAPVLNEQTPDGYIGESLEVKYGVGVRKTRIHQQGFRKRVLLAYGLRCALTNLPMTALLEAAHIISDANGGEASVRNGIAMSTFHHTAYEANLMGIDADGKIHLSEQVAATRDGPMFDYGLLRLNGTKMRLPNF